MGRKQPMFLLEILIALSLVSVCLIPFIKQPLEMHNAEMKRLERVESDRIAAWTFTELREKFLKREFRWEQIPPLQESSDWMSLSDVKLEIPPLPCPAISRRFYLSTTKEKQETDGRVHRFVSVHLEVGTAKHKREFTYHLILTKQPVGLGPVS